MMIQNSNAGQYDVNYSPVMQHRMKAMLKNADKLFSIGWLRKRLWKELGSRISEVPATEYENYGRLLQYNYEVRFMLEFLSVCQKSLADIRQIIGNAYDTQSPLEELKEEREELIREFARMSLSKTWEQVRDDDESWRKFAHRLPLNDPNMKDDIARFFEILDRISIITDIVCHRAKEYGLDVKYNSSTTHDDWGEQRGDLTDEKLARAIEVVSYFLTKKSAWVVVFCVLRDDYGYQNQSQFERDVLKLPFKKKMKDCPDGTISRTMSNNNYLYSPIDKWPPDKNFTKFAADLRAAIDAELAK